MEFLTTEDEKLIDELAPIGHPSTPGYDDPPTRSRGDRSGAARRVESV